MKGLSPSFSPFLQSSFMDDAWFEIRRKRIIFNDRKFFKIFSLYFPWDSSRHGTKSILLHSVSSFQLAQKLQIQGQEFCC